MTQTDVERSSLGEEAENDQGKWAQCVVVNDDVLAASKEERGDFQLRESGQAPSSDVNKLVAVHQEGCRDKLNHSNCPEKTVYVLGVATLITVTCSVTSFPWFIPYLYTFLLSVLIPIRAWKYASLKWQFFLFDWCYFANALTLVYIWAAPQNPIFSMIIFGVCNGPVAWSVVLFRNCLVPHSIERFTCLVVHIMPALLTFIVRWHAAEISTHWYRDFPDMSVSNDVAVGWEFLWLLAVPLGCYMGHLLLYLSLFLFLMGPSDYLNNYTYLANSGDGCISKLIQCRGEKFKVVIYALLQFSYATLTITITVLWFNFRIAQIVFICTIFMIATYNGSTYYLDLYPKKAHNSDPYRLCGKT